MMRLIDADARVAKWKAAMLHIVKDDDGKHPISLEILIDDVDCAPTVDAVPVVRCKDCEYWMYEYDDVGLCVVDVPDVDGVERQAFDFCSYGERKDYD